jgi:hypothetical protein
MSAADDIREAVLAERERIARWHDRQAEALEAAIALITEEGAAIEVTQRSLVHLHRRSAEAIRAGEQ